MMSSSKETPRSNRLFEFLNRRIGIVSGLIVVVTVGPATAPAGGD